MTCRRRSHVAPHPHISFWSDRRIPAVRRNDRLAGPSVRRPRRTGSSFSGDRGGEPRLDPHRLQLVGRSALHRPPRSPLELHRWVGVPSIHHRGHQGLQRCRRLPLGGHGRHKRRRDLQLRQSTPRPPPGDARDRDRRDHAQGTRARRRGVHSVRPGSRHDAGELARGSVQPHRVSERRPLLVGLREPGEPLGSGLHRVRSRLQLEPELVGFL